MLIKPNAKDFYTQVDKAIKKFNPKIVVLAGKHEPLEPSYRILIGEYKGRAFHDNFDHNDVLFIKLPPEHTPLNYYYRVTKIFEKVLSRLIKGLSLPSPKRELSKEGKIFLMEINESSPAERKEIGIKILSFHEQLSAETSRGTTWPGFMDLVYSYLPEPPTDFDIMDHIRSKKRGVFTVTLHASSSKVSDGVKIERVLRLYGGGMGIDTGGHEELEEFLNEEKLAFLLSYPHMVDDIIVEFIYDLSKYKRFPPHIDSKFLKILKIENPFTNHMTEEYVRYHIDPRYAREKNKEYAPALEKFLRFLLKKGGVKT